MRTAASALTGGLAVVALSATSAAAQEEDSTVAVLHGVPGLTVDVYVNGEETIPDFAPGTLTDPLTLPAGSYDIAVYPDGADPETEDPAISADGLEVPGGANLTLVAHLDAGGAPTLSAFANDTSQLEAGEARLTVRHTAAAPAVDVRAGGEPVVQGLENPDEQVLDLPAGTVSADVVAAGSDTVVLGPADLELAEGTNTIVYAWGSLEEENLDLAVQSIDGLHGQPSGVPSGEAGSNSGAWALWALGLTGAAGVVAASRRLGTADAA